MLHLQVGRAGRDGEHATCQTLVSGADLPLLRSIIYGSTPSPAAVRGLLRTVFAGEGDEASFNFYDISQVNAFGHVLGRVGIHKVYELPTWQIRDTAAERAWLTSASG